MSEPLLQIKYSHWLFGIEELRRNRGARAMAGDVAPSISGRHACLAAKYWDQNSVQIYEQEKQKGNANRATLAVARKMVAYLVAVDRRQNGFLVVENKNRTAA